MSEDEAGKTPDWGIWGNITRASAKELAFLSCNADPSGNEFKPFDHYQNQSLADTIKARSSLIDRELEGFLNEPFGAKKFKVADFREWVASLNPPWELPDQFPGETSRVSLTASRNPDAETALQGNHIAKKKRNTYLIIIMALLKNSSIDWRESNKSRVSEVRKIIEETGNSVDDKTIRSILKELEDQ